MKRLFKLSELLYWIACVGAFWVTTVMYPFSVYYYKDNVPFLNIKELLILAGITAVLGTVMYLVLALVGAVGKFIGFKKNLITFFFYHFLIGTAFGAGADYLLDCIKFSPYWIYLLIGFFPATLCSIIFSYEVSKNRKKTKKAA